MPFRMPEVSLPLYQWLTQEGDLLPDAPALAHDAALMRRAYAAISETRLFDQKVIALQRTGRMGTYASCLGQEAISVAIGLCMQPEDVLCPYYRDQAAQLLRGVQMTEIFAYWGGFESGNAYNNVPNDLPNCVPIATQLPHACGVASAFRYRHEPRVAVATCGDGATSRGDFYEAMNLAGVWHLPMVIVVNNNQWAISVPLSRQTAAASIAHKAYAAGIAGVRVDGNDMVAMLQVLGEALARARAGKGPTLVEAVTYRLCDHTTADDARRYRSDSELEQHKQGDPLLRLRHLLQHMHGWSAQEEEVMLESIRARIDTAVEHYLAMPAMPPESMFRHLFASLPVDMEEQQKILMARVQRREQNGGQVS